MFGVRRIVALFCLAIVAPGLAQCARAQSGGPPWSALVDPVGAGEIVLGRVCLTGIAERRSIAELAHHEYLVAVPPRDAGAGASDEVWRLASVDPVYAVAWTDGSCTTSVQGGPSDKLRLMAERVILARPERFVLRSSRVVGTGQFDRAIYCGQAGGAPIAATISTPHDVARGGFTSTVYSAGPGDLCYRAQG